MNKFLQKSVLATGLLVATATWAQAQKFGDNLGNHTATKDLQMNNMSIFNAKGIAIGSAAISNASVALQIDGASQALLISRVAANTDIATPLDGMIIYNAVDKKFYLRQNGAWVTFALALKASTDGIATVSDPNGYTLTQVGQETVLKLTPADKINPGVVTIAAQEFSGNKTFLSDVTLATGAKFSVTDGATKLGSTLDVVGNVTLATGAKLNVTDGATKLGGTLEVIGSTALAGSQTVNGAQVSAIKIDNPVNVLATDVQHYLVIDADGNVKKGSASNALNQYQVALPTAVAGSDFDSEGNSAATFILNINEIKKDDAIVVNFSSGSIANFAGLTILSATAIADGKVSVTIADLRNPAASGYTAPAITGSKLVVTKYNAGQ